MPYLPEVRSGQSYKIDGEIYMIIGIRATNIITSEDYIIAVTFRSGTKTFDEKLENVIGNDEFKLMN